MEENITKENREDFPKLRDSNDYINVTQHTWGVTKAGQESEVLKTVGLGQCVGIAIYDPDSHTAGLLHMDGASHKRHSARFKGPDEDMVGLLMGMQNNGVSVEGRDELSATVVASGQGKELAHFVRDRLETLGLSNVELWTAPQSSAIAIDSKDGEIYEITHVLPVTRTQDDKLDDISLRISAGLSAARPTKDKRSLK